MNEEATRAPTVVVKLGGEVVTDRAQMGRLLSELATWVAQGWRVVLVHGGGLQTEALQRRLGLTPHKVGGRRVTDSETLLVAKQVLAGEVNTDVVAQAHRHGLRGVGLGGVSLVSATRRPPVEGVDFGWVGTIEQTDVRPLVALIDAGYVPVVAPLGRAIDSADEAAYNINADTIAAALAGAIAADHLFLVTSVDGVRTDRAEPGTRVAKLTVGQAQRLLACGAVEGGMIPKVVAAISDAAAALVAVHIVGPGLRSIRDAVRDPGCDGTAVLRRSASVTPC